ncbi:hypothetical protein TBK1r_01550 [Stieleria magnilauensis]|uniref:Uncharacterized protein n=1 Tax=Stieleria magnilauensis TaxID=2527963 RepID=A0ABX5XGX6_9BACT|nr:hypothetical protein TBK1r_01550 [Planctomycetes bacterium TBK1r]
MPANANQLSDLVRGTVAVQTLAEIMAAKTHLPSSRKRVQDKRLETLKELSDLSIDPEVFDTMLSNELNRQLKHRFAVGFLILAVAFSSISYLIVVADAIWKLGIPTSVLVALLVQTPIQLIGLLHIIARNLFPNPVSSSRRISSASSEEKGGKNPCVS